MCERRLSCQERLLSICLTGRPGTPCSLSGYSDRQWNKFVRTASNELILPALYDVSQKSNLSEDLPSDVRSALSVINQLNRSRNRAVLDQLRLICAHLNEHGIEPVVLKGVANLLAGVYPDVGTRYLADVDFLIPEGQFALSVDLLGQLGYRCDESDPVEFKIGHTYPPLRRAGWIEIDLHRVLGLGTCRSFLPVADVFSQSVPHEWEGVCLRLPCPEHLITHHIMHSQMHDSYRDRVWPSLRGLYDLALLSNKFDKDAKWANIETRFAAKKQRDLLVMYLLHARDLLGVDIPIEGGMTASSHLRWQRRKLLRKTPWLRFVDPLYWFLAGFLPRTRRLHEILNVPGGWKYLARKFVSPQFYARLRADLS